jgi:hypothetical protein
MESLFEILMLCSTLLNSCSDNPQVAGTLPSHDPIGDQKYPVCEEYGKGRGI